MTRGDALLAFDLPVAAHEILGTVAAIFRSEREIPVRKSGPSLAGGLLAFALRHTRIAFPNCFEVPCAAPPAFYLDGMGD